MHASTAIDICTAITRTAGHYPLPPLPALLACATQQQVQLPADLVGYASADYPEWHFLSRYALLTSCRYGGCSVVHEAARYAQALDEYRIGKLATL